ncbi:PE-PGRS family protein [Streptomyces aureoverticillatus]|uniref:PE-PGRS family protein n=1 Tax=Streptomyces aureoverticillatus TaxID=66871 RepID=UPI0013DB2A90|nr:PE-PGRS family protein [Streptomyces aureoverticillatus]QIB45499.1 PE-PGRS family protein [Streptomyces aureoverticillatus]
MRNVNPGDLEQLSKLIDGRGGVGDKLKEAFTRASNLGVTSKLSTVRSLDAWATEQGSDLRRRAALVRLENGDPEAGLRWAGFTTEDLKKYEGRDLTPDDLLLANSVAASDEPGAKGFARQDGEAIVDWIDRVKAHALAKIPGLQSHEQTIQTLVGLYGDWRSVTDTAGVATFQGVALTRVLVTNSFFRSAQLRSWKIRAGTVLRGSSHPWVRDAGSQLVRFRPELQSLSAPGSWLPSRLALWAGAPRNIPLVSGMIDDRVSMRYDAARRLPFMDSPVWRGITANKAINAIVGNDTLAKRFGGTTHSGEAVARAGQANLFKVGKEIFTRGRAVGWSRGLALTKGLAGAGKVSGALRGVGVVGGVWSTYLATDQLVHRGLPWNHGNFSTRQKGARYVANVAEVGFHASLTAATVAPNPYTIGATVVFGGVYVGAKVVEHWDGIKKGAGKVVDEVGETAKEAVRDPVGTGKKIGRKLDPRNLF